MSFFKFVLLFTALTGTVYGETKNVLPKKQEAMDIKILLGDDKNKNNVRDDVELLIQKEITKNNAGQYRAYLKYAESISNIIKYYPDIQKVKENERLINKTQSCLSLVDNDVFHVSSSISAIINKVFDTKERAKIDKWYAENSHLFDDDEIISKDKIKAESCIF